MVQGSVASRAGERWVVVAGRFGEQGDRLVQGTLASRAGEGALISRAGEA